MVGDLFDLFLNSIFAGNILLAYFLGMCSFVAISKNINTAIGLGFAVVFVLGITTPINWLMYHYLLAPGALTWAGLSGMDLSFLKFILFIAVIAAVVQAIEMVIDRFSSALYAALGVFLPLISVNCAILGASLMAAIRIKLRYANAPYGLAGYGLTMIVTGLMAMAFMLFSGMTV